MLYNSNMLYETLVIVTVTESNSIEIILLFGNLCREKKYSYVTLYYIEICQIETTLTFIMNRICEIVYVKLFI